jgi:hypothetical protein
MILNLCKYIICHCISSIGGLDKERVFDDKNAALHYINNRSKDFKASPYERFVVYFGEPNANGSVPNRQVILEIKIKNGVAQESVEPLL